MLTELKVKDFIAEVASSSPAPGGGSVAALSAASGAGLISMLANLTKGKKGYEDCWDEMGKIADHCTLMAKRFVEVIDEDTKAFEVYMDAIRMPKDTDEQKAKRSAAMQAAAEGATMVPLNLAREAFTLVDSAAYVVKHGNTNATSDGAVAMLMLRSGIIGAILNVRINLGSIKNENLVSSIRQEIDELEQKVNDFERNLLSTVNL